MSIKPRTLLFIVAAILAAGVAVTGEMQYSGATLWRIISTDCIPAAAQTGGTGHCAEVALAGGIDNGYVVLKDQTGPLQYLLMPSRRVTGIEDPFLLTPQAPPFWADAWNATRWMAIAHRKPVSREAIAITVNSAWGRSQNQLHLHISCVRPDLRAFLHTLPAANSASWTAIPGGWQGHPYEVRKLMANTLDGQDLFKDTARQHVDAMGQQGLAAVAMQIDGKNGFWLLRTHVDLMAMWTGAIEGDVQDHGCSKVR
jgi:CDP-diacylglycerol pyrophosphatase